MPPRSEGEGRAMETERRRYAVEMKAISKHFGGIYALRHVDFRLKEGSIHALLGENGAGKSTLMKILSGLLYCDEGEILRNGKPADLRGYTHAQQQGIAIIPQELSLVESFTAAENIFLGREDVKLGLIDKRKTNQRAAAVFEELKIDIDPAAPVKTLSVSQQQMLVIAKVLSLNAEVLIMDEPTARLGLRETEELLQYVQYLRSIGKSIVYISHKLEEIFQVCDEVTVLRDGRKIATHNVRDITTDKLIEEMVNRSTEQMVIDLKHSATDEEILRVEEIRNEPLVKNVSFHLRKGEILGFYGLVGSGRTEMIRAIMGIDKCAGGRVFFNGERVRFKNIRQSIARGIVLVPEERRRQGLIMRMTICQNSTMNRLKRFVRMGLINRKKEVASVREMIDSLKIACRGVDQKVGDLSGGNQQKVVLSKYLATPVNIYVFDEPTRGIDVGAKNEIYALIDDVAAKGAAVILISSEIPELQGICDRVVVMREGETVAELQRDEFQNAETVLKHSIGGSSDAASE